MGRKLFSLAFLIVAASAARADYGTFANGRVYTNIGAPTLKFDSVGGMQTSASIDLFTDETVNIPGYFGYASSRLKVRTDLGQIHAYGYAMANTNLYTGVEGGYAQFTHNDDHPGGEVGNWFDFVHVNSASLAAGTPVQLRVRATLEGTKSSFTPYPHNLNHAYLSASLGSGFALVVMNDTSAITSSEFVVDTFVGATLGLSSSLEIAGDTSFTNGGPSYATVDAWNTGITTLESLTPGATFSTDSGVTYSPSAVPEPATMGTLALGAAALLRRRRKA